jgi:hypothetical protein
MYNEVQMSNLRRLQEIFVQCFHGLENVLLRKLCLPHIVLEAIVVWNGDLIQFTVSFITCGIEQQKQRE